MDREQAHRREASLPYWGTTFIGREKLLARIADLFASRRLVTLTGPAGIGKSRLAGEFARMADWFPRATWVSIWPVATEWLVSYAVSGAAPGVLPPAETSLVVIDGCDRWPAVVRAGIERLLAEHPGLSILATSRDPLASPEESIVKVGRLGLPRTTVTGAEAVQRSESTRLLWDRVQLVAPATNLNKAVAATIGEICIRLDGVPLALELVACRMRSEPATDVAARLRILLNAKGGGRPASLRLAFDLVHELLDKNERGLFRRLGSFAGSCRPVDAATVAWESGSADSVARVVGLAEKVLLIRRDPAGRLYFSQSLWEDSRERLRASKEERKIGGRHAHFFLNMAEDADENLTGPDQRAWTELLEAERDNLLAALAWTLEYDPDRALAIAAALAWFWYSCGHLRQGRDLLVLALGSSRRSDAVRQKALEGVGRIAWREQDFSGARGFLEESVAIQRDQGDLAALARALNGLGVLAIELGDFPIALERLDESLRVMRDLGDRRGIALVLSNLGMMARYSGDRSGASAFFDESLELFRRELARMSAVPGPGAGSAGRPPAESPTSEQAAPVQPSLPPSD